MSTRRGASHAAPRRAATAGRTAEEIASSTKPPATDHPDATRSPSTQSPGALHAIVLFGDVVGSRRAPAAAAAWLRRLAAELDRLYAAEALASFGFTQGDELQGLLTASADPVRAVLF